MANQKQKMRYSDNELSLIKATFADDEAMLLILRKVFLHAELSDGEIKLLEPISKSPQAIELMRKAYAPALDLDAPFGQLIDLWMTIDTKEMTPEMASLALKVRAELNELLEAGLARLASPKNTGTRTVADYTPDFDASDEDKYVTYTSRNALISHTETRLLELSLLAGQKNETVEETVTRLQQDSAK